MTGWRLGYVVAPGEMGTVLFSVHRAIDGPICTFVQRAGAAALRGSQACVAEMRREYQQRGALMHRLAREIPASTPWIRRAATTSTVVTTRPCPRGTCASGCSTRA